MDSSFAPDYRPRARADLVFRRVGGDWLVFDPRTQEIHVLNLSAALVWSFCTGDHPVEEIGREVRSAFQDDIPGDPVADVLQRFQQAGLLAP